MVQEDGAGSEYHEESRQQHSVVHQRGDPSTESGVVRQEPETGS